MTRVQIKNKAKGIFAANRALFIKIFMLYFGVLLFALLFTYIYFHFGLILSLLPDMADMLLYLQTNVYSTTLSEILLAFLSAPVFLMLYTAVFELSDGQNNKLTFKSLLCKIKEPGFIKKSLALGLIMAVIGALPKAITAVFDPPSHPGFHANYIIANVSTRKLLLAAIDLVFIIASFFLDFLFCVAALFPKKSVLWAVKTSAKTIAKNLVDYIAFIISFMPWWLIQFAGFIILMIIWFSVNTLQYTYTASLLSFLFVSPITMGAGFYFWPYFNSAKAIFCRELIASTEE